MKDSPGDGSVLAFRQVRREFTSFLPRRRVVALEELSLDVRPGEIVGLIGPNGSGKTTAFRLAAGLLRAGAGSITVFGGPPGARAARTRQGYMPEQPGVPENLTPAELLHFVGRVFGMTSAGRAKRIEELSELLSLSGFLKRRMAGFSKGMIKRVGLAAALFNEPELLLLDEPLEGIDPLGSAAIKEHVRSLSRRGCAVLVSSHILSDVEALCTSLLIVNEGKVILHGRKDDILSLRDMMEMRFTAPDGAGIAEKVKELVERCGGEVRYSGRPRETLESLFSRILAPEREGQVEG